MISCHGFCRSARRPSIPIAVTKMTYGTSAFGYSWWKGQAFEATQSPRRMGTKDVAGDVEGKGKGNEDLDNSLQNRVWLHKRTGGVCLSIASKGLAITGIGD
ncbi:uncharacterized protein LOC126703676 isoform X1 [Quercus robur]|uniref:uncharacterized protein LOC126703676 isoform X1 n=1 Tax=Quercus robur TaxID=38942 RepID=UPI002163F438|nr:uncharacterized protein LOC126703676 isoform X1 [Quercus robur]